jgi:hypothetical protein
MVDVSMNLEGTLGAASCTEMETIHILSDQSEAVGQHCIERNQVVVGFVRKGSPTNISAP